MQALDIAIVGVYLLVMVGGGCLIGIAQQYGRMWLSLGVFVATSARLKFTWYDREAAWTQAANKTSLPAVWRVW